jgi:(E)-4-hydroxy-3-methylbut-2-enyl-diphosphate synthase
LINHQQVPQRQNYTSLPHSESTSQLLKYLQKKLKKAKLTGRIMDIQRRPTKKITVGKLILGGGEPIRVQSMCTTYTAEVGKTVRQIHELEKVGCELIRVNITDEASANALSHIKKQINIPLVADVLFDDELIIKSIRRGADKIRINPGKFNFDNLKRVIEEAKIFHIPIRIGINAGALPKDILNKYGPTAEGMVEAASAAVSQFEKLDFDDLIISLKSSDIRETVKANIEFSKCSYYPIHLGVTQSGTALSGVVRSSTAFGHLLLSGIGDTLRYSLSGDPVSETLAGHYLLRSLGLREGPVVIAGSSSRSSINVDEIAKQIEKEMITVKAPLRVCIIGSLVEKDEMNTADIGVAGDGNEGVIFKKGEIITRVKKERILEVLLEEIRKLISIE